MERIHPVLRSLGAEGCGEEWSKQMISLPMSVWFWLFLAVFLSGLSIGIGIYSFFIWRQKRREAEVRSAEKKIELVDFVAKGLRSIDGGKKN